MGRIYDIRSLGLCALPMLFLAFNTAQAQTPISIEGATGSPALPNAEVTLFNGSETTTSVADDDGRFSVDLLDSDDDLVRIQACGVGDQSHICYTRLVHTAQHITEQADSNDAFRTGTVSPLSTIAYASLVKFGLDGQAPQNWNDISNLVRAYHVYDMLDDSATLFNFAQFPQDIPAGFDNLLELALDEQALNNATDNMDPQVLAPLVDGLLSRPGWFLVPEAQFPIDSTLLTTASPGQTANLAYSIELDSDASGVLSTGAGSGLVEWENMADGDLIFADDIDFSGINVRGIAMLPAEGDTILPPSSGFVPVDGIPESVEVVSKYPEAEWRMFNASEALPIGLLSITTEVTAPGYPELGPGDIPTLGTSISRFPLSAKLSDADLPAWTGPDAGSSWAFPRCDVDCQSEAGVVSGPNLDIIDFANNGNATGTISNESLSWSYDGEIYTLGQPDGITVEVIPLGASSSDLGDLETFRVVSRGLLPNGQIRTTGHLIMQADPGLALADPDIPGRYQLATPILDGSTLQLNPDQTGWSALLDDPNDPRPKEGGRDFQWEILASGDLLLEILPRGIAFVQATAPLLPVQETPQGLYAIQRLAFGSQPQTASAGTLYFLEFVAE